MFQKTKKKKSCNYVVNLFKYWSNKIKKNKMSNFVSDFISGTLAKREKILRKYIIQEITKNPNAVGASGNCICFVTIYRMF